MLQPRTLLRPPKYVNWIDHGGISASFSSGIQKQVFNNNQPSQRPSRTLPSPFQKKVFVPKNTSATSGLTPNRHVALVEDLTPTQMLHTQEQLKQLLSKYSSGVWLSKIPQIYQDLFKQNMHPSAVKDLENWTHICCVEKPGRNQIVDRLVYPTGNIPSKPTPVASPPQTKPTSLQTKPSSLDVQTPLLPTPPHSPLVISADDKQKLRKLLEKQSSGLWADSLPNLFQEAFKSELPEQVLADLSVLSDSCVIEYPMPNKEKAILYPLATMEEESPENPVVLPHQWLANSLVPPLLLPVDDYLSVLVVEALSTNSLVIRYIGPAYSQALEAMEDSMREFYVGKKQSMAPCVLLANRLYAVVNEEFEVLRAQLCEDVAGGVKVYYVDHGFSDVVDKDKIRRLHEQFLRLPFQTSTCSLAGLSDFHTKSAVLKVLESQVCGHILLAEVVEKGEVPLVVLYDTSQKDDININSACLKALQDGSLCNPLTVNSIYLNVSVTYVCPDGTIFCQVPCCGLARLKSLFEKIETFFSSMESSELPVTKPFQGKICLALFEGKWSRVEITETHGSCVVDILFVDLGHPASVKVTELREIPPAFLHDVITIPFQALKCTLEELSGEGVWSAKCFLWLTRNVLHTNCSMKISRLDQSQLVHIYLFSSNSCHELSSSINQQLLNSGCTSPMLALAEHCTSLLAAGDAASLPVATEGLALPLVLHLPQVGQTIEVFVSVACHPGHFVVQVCEDLFKLTALMGDMIVHYNNVQFDEALTVEKNLICAAMVEKNWYRVLVKGVLGNELVCVYELDYGKHELVSSGQLRPLINKFRQLPFQAIVAELADVKLTSWSEESTMVFRYHVEKRTLTALVKSVQDAAFSWDRKLALYLRDKSEDHGDVWLNKVMVDFRSELNKPE
ncbi:hypothetical protein ACEWY4_007499 [Coilia grayii]|uniref:Tudor domain-containing protein 7 n=1 Tax=Coilia grayii TaxID=363190 RepID=A0ABD1KGP3_9TELE